MAQWVKVHAAQAGELDLGYSEPTEKSGISLGQLEYWQFFQMRGSRDGQILEAPVPASL